MPVRPTWPLRIPVFTAYSGSLPSHLKGSTSSQNAEHESLGKKTGGYSSTCRIALRSKVINLTCIFSLRGICKQVIFIVIWLVSTMPKGFMIKPWFDELSNELGGAWINRNIKCQLIMSVSKSVSFSFLYTYWLTLTASTSLAAIFECLAEIKPYNIHIYHELYNKQKTSLWDAGMKRVYFLPRLRYMTCATL